MESTSYTRVVPVTPAAPYIGGKRILAKRLVQIIDRHDHTTYAEPFVGMGGVFFKRTRQPKSEYINDRSRDVATFFRILQRHYIAFLDMLRYQITTRDEFERLVAVNADTLTDLERAARFIYLQRTAFGGKVAGRHFGVSPDRSARFDVTKLVPILEAIYSRLTSVTIECLDYQDFLRRYDRPATLFFLDPPYIGCEGDYGAGMFGPADFERLKDVLGGLQGSFIMTLNDHPKAHELFSEFDIEPAKVRYSVGGGAGVEAGELIISRLR